MRIDISLKEAWSSFLDISFKAGFLMNQREISM